MYGNVQAYSFTVSDFPKSKFKTRSVVDNLATTVADVRNLCSALDTINNDFGRLNNCVGSDEWSKDAADISTITENIRSMFSQYCTNLTGHIETVNQSVNQANTRLAGTVAANQGKISGILQNIEGINPSR